MNTAPAEFRDFSGGFTDYYLDGPMNKYRFADNFLLVKHGEIGKPYTRNGSELFDADNPQLPSGNQRVGSLRFFNDTLFCHSSRNIYYIDGTFQTLTGPTGNAFFPPSVGVNDVASYTPWNNHVFVSSTARIAPLKMYFDGSGNPQVRTAGLPALFSAPTVTPTAGAGTYTYRFLYKYEYTVGTVLFIDRGPSTEVQTTSAALTINHSNIPVLANGVTNNYDTASANLVVEIYRTTNGGTDFYYVGEVQNGTTIFADNVSDATLVTNEPLYTTGGAVEYEPPPSCGVFHVTEDVGYAVQIVEGGETLEYEIRQSIPGKPDAMPGDFSAPVDDRTVSVSSVKGVPVVLCEGSAWRVDGRYDELGRGGMVATKISDTAGCIGADSVVQTLEGVFWWGPDAVYFTDGFSVIPLNEDWDETHRSLVQTATQKRHVQGRYDRANRRIWWSVASADECDSCVVLDLNFGVRRRATFTTCSGGEANPTNFKPTAIEFDDGDLIRGDARGYILKHTDGVYVDPLIDTSIAAANWSSVPVVWKFETCALSFGSNFERKFIPRIVVQALNETNLSLQVVSINDDGRREGELAVIRYRGNFVWGDPEFVWGDPDFEWNRAGFIEEQRRMPAGHLRCSYKALRFENAFVVITTSDIYGTADVNATLKTVTLTDAATKDWPTDPVGYFIAFENDWDLEFLITARTADTVTFLDTANDAVDLTGQEWEIRGAPKNEAFRLISYLYDFAQFGKTQDTFKASETGSIADE